MIRLLGRLTAALIFGWAGIDFLLQAYKFATHGDFSHFSVTLASIAGGLLFIERALESLSGGKL